jgi:hypothetical protein
MEATPIEGLLPLVDMPDDYDEDFCAEVFDEPKAITKGEPTLINALYPVAKSELFAMSPKINLHSEAIDEDAVVITMALVGAPVEDPCL